MSWFRVDDGFHNHPKTIAVGTAAAGLFARCGSYAAQHLTDGFVPAEIARQYGTATMIRRLVDVGMWTAEAGGFRMHDYLDYNPSREKVDIERAKAAERIARYREKRAGNAVSNSVGNGVTNGVQHPLHSQDNESQGEPNGRKNMAESASLLTSRTTRSRNGSAPSTSASQQVGAVSLWICNAVSNGAPGPSRPDPEGVGSGWDGDSRSVTRADRPVDNSGSSATCLEHRLPVPCRSCRADLLEIGGTG